MNNCFFIFRHFPAFCCNKRISAAQLPLFVLGFILCLPFTAQSAKILAFGDSITAGNLQQTGGYVPILKEKLNKAGNFFEVLNSGKWGETTSAGVMRIDAVLAAFPADIVLIMEGSNDAMSGIPVTTTEQNLQVLIYKVKGAGAIPVLSTLPPSNRREAPRLIPNIWNPMIKALAERNDIRYIDTYAKVIDDWPSLNRDGIHPNDLGHAVLAGIWYDTIITMVDTSGATIANLTGDDSLCLFAYAAAGSPVEKHLGLLKEFRNHYLTPYATGRKIVTLYYRHSPTTTDFIRHHTVARHLVQFSLYPLVVFCYAAVRLSPATQLVMIIAMVALVYGLNVVKRRRKATAEKGKIRLP